MSAVFASTFLGAHWRWDAVHRKFFARDVGEVAVLFLLAEFINDQVALRDNHFETLAELLQRLRTCPSLFLIELPAVFCPRVCATKEHQHIWLLCT